MDAPIQLLESAVREAAHNSPRLASVSGEQSLCLQEIVQLAGQSVDIAIWRFPCLYILDLLRCSQNGNEQSSIGRLNQRAQKRVCRSNQSVVATEHHDGFVVRLSKREEGCE